MKRSLVLILAVLFLQPLVMAAESLDDWLAAQIRADEQLLTNSLSQTGGHTLDLLRESRTYIPFFLEPPSHFVFESQTQKASFNAFVNGNANDFLPGGYIFRLTFDRAPPLYAMSAGEWSGTSWRSLELSKDLTIEPDRVWPGAGDDYLYATLIAGVPPRLLVYDRGGNLKREESFDTTTANFEQRLQATTDSYSKHGKPVLEMISLGEYVENPRASWGRADTSGLFNLRNQQQRDKEKERLQSIRPLSRNTTIESLQSRTQADYSPRENATADLLPKVAAMSATPAQIVTIPTPTTPPATAVEQRAPVWPWVAGILALAVVALLVWKRR